METINTLNTSIVQNRLNKYFNSFQEERINGVPFNIMPPKEAVPLIRQVAYDKDKDIFEIVFKFEATVKLNRQGNIIFIEDTEGHLVGIQVIKLRENDINKVTLEIIANLDKVIQAARIKLESNPSPKDAVALDLEERKADFFKEIIKTEMPNLVK